MSWEYQHVLINAANENRETKLNEYGREGWELVSIIQSVYSPTLYEAFFKRRIGQ